MNDRRVWKLKNLQCLPVKVRTLVWVGRFLTWWQVVLHVSGAVDVVHNDRWELGSWSRGSAVGWVHRSTINSALSFTISLWHLCHVSPRLVRCKGKSEPGCISEQHFARIIQPNQLCEQMTLCTSLWRWFWWTLTVVRCQLLVSHTDVWDELFSAHFGDVWQV